MSDKKQTMAMISLNDGVVMPGLTFYLDVKRKDSCNAVEYAIKNEEMIFLASPMPREEGDAISFYDVGVIAEVKQFVRLAGQTMRVLLYTHKRARLVSYTKDMFYSCEIQEVKETCDLSQDEKEAFLSILREKLEKSYECNIVKNKVQYKEVRDCDKLDELVDKMADYIKLSDNKRQELLEISDVRLRATRLINIVDELLSIGDIKKEILDKVNKETAKHQREYVLREELSVIRKELGENGVDKAVREFRERLDSCGCSREVYEKIEKEITHYQNIPQNSSESSVVANYIDVLLEYPWNISTKDNDDINAAIKILDKDHYGLEEVKERIIDYLAVHILSSKGELPIICLVGPPGTGKTSIARSIARATGRKYVRMSLGGVRDEAEIRGHRKTYVGAMPGRIAQSMIKIKTNNPLMLLDEIDKVGSDYKGDVSSALLEVLDGEQNKEFNDHFFGVPIDLSNVLFIATANDASKIPGPLLDRMEIINISGYTENEKYHIAKLYLVDKARERNGLAKRQMKFDAGSIRDIIRYYTREAGVRGLERNIDKICRKACRKLLTEDIEEIKITRKNVDEYLGPHIYKDEDGNLANKTGVVRGLAWTAVGGVTLEIQVNVFSGKGQLILTGKMGDVMKESAQAGLSFIRSLKESEKLGKDYFSSHDFHIHIPEGAVPKDGPSAGITMATALYSAIFNVPVNGKLAMTGEITLRGDVLPIGGLKEKLLAAKMIGVKKVLIPSKNQADFAKLDEEITSGLCVETVDNMRQVLEFALVR
ncbi:MAG: endopeptidase La [Coprococcus sp.]|nr:endopeptidase La [Coprococcus sp.]